MVRPARFERATYGFEEWTSELPNLSTILYVFKFIKDLNCEFFLIFTNFIAF
jgi:hypothetical protein